MEIKRVQLPLQAKAEVRGSRSYPNIRGSVVFSQRTNGVLVTAEVYGLPYTDRCNSGIFAFHVHSGNSCTGNASDALPTLTGISTPTAVSIPTMPEICRRCSEITDMRIFRSYRPFFRKRYYRARGNHS